MTGFWPICVRYRLWFLITLMAVLDITAVVRHRIVTLLIVAIALNAIACGWVVVESFRRGRHALPLRHTAVIFALLIILNALVFSGTYMRLQQSKMPLVVLSEKAPAFEWTEYDGTRHRSSELSGHVVVLHFWATWCAPCRKEFPKLTAFAHTQPNILFLTVSSDSEEAKPENFIRSIHEDVHLHNPPNLLFAWDPNNAIAHDVFHNLSYPATVIVDPSGRMRYKFIMPVDWGSPAIKAYLTALEKP
jgi:thiol-disulfide isomerase/thioredoxin